MPQPPSLDPDDRRLLALLAAVAVLTLVGTVALMTWWNRPVAFDAPADQPLAVRLPDGATVTLDPGARLRTSRRTRGAVGLDGGATVQPHHDDPVVVVTRDAQIDALGGHVLVRSSGAGTDVHVADGAAQVAPRDRVDLAVALGPGEGAHIGPGGE